MAERNFGTGLGPEAPSPTGSSPPGRLTARLDGRLLFGLMLLTLGVLFTLDNMNILESDGIIKWWPAVLVAVGLFKLLGIGTTRHLVWGTMFTVFGTMMLGDNLGQWDFEFWNFWPLVMVFVGGSLLARGLKGRPAGTTNAAGEFVVDPGKELRSFALMSGVTRRIVSQEFRGGELSAVMGGVEIDLRGARTENGVAMIEVFVWWGGIDIKVPEGWAVANEGLAVMGAVEDTTKATPDGKNTLVIRGLVVMGGVEIKN